MESDTPRRDDQETDIEPNVQEEETGDNADAESRAKRVTQRVESALKILGLTPFSARVVMQYIAVS